MVAVVALAWKTDAIVPPARVRLNAIAANTSQALFAANDPSVILSRCVVDGVVEGVSPTIWAARRHRRTPTGSTGDPIVPSTLTEPVRQVGRDPCRLSWRQGAATGTWSCFALGRGRTHRRATDSLTTGRRTPTPPRGRAPMRRGHGAWRFKSGDEIDEPE